MGKQSENNTNDLLKPKETWRIIKNIVVISIAFMVQFTAFSGAANLQSSINAKAGLGTASLAAIYAGLIFSNIFLPSVVIRWLGTKLAISLSFVTYMPYIAAQLHPTFYTLIPTGLMVGLGGGPLWCAKCTYLTVVSEFYSKISNIATEVLLGRFFGLFFMIFQTNQIWGNLISSLVLTTGDNKAAVTAINASLIPEVCGYNFLPSTDAEQVLQTQPYEKIAMIVGIYLACMAAAAIIVAVGVDSMKRYETSSSATGSGASGFQLFLVTLKLMLEPKQLMIIIINLFIGYQQAFFGADFTAAYVSCAIGTGTVGFIMVTYGLSDAIGCMLTGYLAKFTGRVALICSALAVNTAIFITMLLWKPQAHLNYMLYIFAVIWGLCDSVWLVQINAFVGTLFPGKEEAAYANFRLWESVGYIIAYVLSPYLRISHKIYLLLAMMYIGAFFYYIVEYMQSRNKNSFAVTENRESKDEMCKKGCDNLTFVKD